MKPVIYVWTVETFVPMLRSLSGCLDKGAELARMKAFDPAVLVSARLAPDMYSLDLQVRLACDQADDAFARLTGREPPKFDDIENTLDDLKARIMRTIVYLESIDAAAFERAEERRIEISLPGNMAFEMTGLEFARDWAVPQFYFHVVAAYAILRHNGVQIGIQDYLSHVATYIRPRGAPA